MRKEAAGRDSKRSGSGSAKTFGQNLALLRCMPCSSGPPCPMMLWCGDDPSACRKGGQGRPEVRVRYLPGPLDGLSLSGFPPSTCIRGEQRNDLLALFQTSSTFLPSDFPLLCWSQTVLGKSLSRGRLQWAAGLLGCQATSAEIQKWASGFVCSVSAEGVRVTLNVGKTLE